MSKQYPNTVSFKIPSRGGTVMDTILTTFPGAERQDLQEASATALVVSVPKPTILSTSASCAAPTANAWVHSVRVTPSVAESDPATENRDCAGTSGLRSLARCCKQALLPLGLCISGPERVSRREYDGIILLRELTSVRVLWGFLPVQILNVSSEQLDGCRTERRFWEPRFGFNSGASWVGFRYPAPSADVALIVLPSVLCVKVQSWGRTSALWLLIPNQSSGAEGSRFSLTALKLLLCSGSAFTSFLFLATYKLPHFLQLENYLKYLEVGYYRKSILLITKDE